MPVNSFQENPFAIYQEISTLDFNPFKSYAQRYYFLHYPSPVF